MCRILEIKLHKLTSIITFTEIFAKCRIENSHSEVKRRVCDIIVAFMKHLQTKGEIRNFEF